MHTQAYHLALLKSYDQKNKLHKIEYQNKETERAPLESKIFYIFNEELGDQNKENIIQFEDHFHNPMAKLLPNVQANPLISDDVKEQPVPQAREQHVKPLIYKHI
jgi:hypothetical protein